MIDFLTTVANAAPQGQVSAEVLIAVIGAIFSGGALWIGKIIGERKAQSMRLEDPVPTVPTRKVPGIVTWDHLSPLISRMDRLERHLDEVRKEQTDQFKEILEAGSTREQRLVDKIDDVARAIHARIDDHLPRTRTNRG